MNTGVVYKPKNEPTLDLSEIFEEMLSLDAKRTGIGRVLNLMGGRRYYEELFEKACETVLTRHKLAVKIEQSSS